MGRDYLMIIWVITHLFGSILLAIAFNLDLTAFDLIRNYKKWKEMNWVGVCVGTIILHIIYLPIATMYWMYRLLKIGRK